ncbi:hypothetical protein NDU88_004802 [Pleurodeles waltl]|uniref:Uncharacterized protein n=1 Tax=Pleurodeles waltl TaxID=8319 RepID=A0AAV7MUY3_PLEWA|nr:hypothetical protein NDU88_004802 [Pleurodeles waltl]
MGDQLTLGTPLGRIFQEAVVRKRAVQLLRGQAVGSRSPLQMGFPRYDSRECLLMAWLSRGAALDTSKWVTPAWGSLLRQPGPATVCHRKGFSEALGEEHKALDVHTAPATKEALKAFYQRYQ